MRQSDGALLNIQLLKIILFLMVVTIHITSPYLSYSTVTGTVNWQFAHLLDGLSRPAVNCFVLVTGYFLCVKKTTHPARRITKIIGLLCANLLFYFIIYALDEKSAARGFVAMLASLFKNDRHFYHLWYLETILFVYAFADYLNLVAAKVSRAGFQKLIAALSVPAVLLPSVNYITGFNLFNTILFDSRLALFVLLYCIGAYIRMHGATEAQSVKRPLALFLLAEGAVVLFSFLYNYRTSPYILAQRILGNEARYPFGGFIGAFFDYNSILVVCASVCLFSLFLRIRIAGGAVGRAVNRLAAQTQGGYIIHVFWINILSRFSAVSPFGHAGSPMYPAYALFAIGLVYFLSLISSFSLDCLIRAIRRLIHPLTRPS